MLDTGDRDHDLDGLDQSFCRFSDSVDEERVQFLVGWEGEHVLRFVKILILMAAGQLHETSASPP